jgi:hypothetical protein
MKQVLLILAFLTLPLSVPAMTPLGDSELDQVSGQSGVSIVPNITMDIHFDVLAWGDADGIGGASTGGYAGVTDFSIRRLSIGLRTEDLDNMFARKTIIVDGLPVTFYDTRINYEILRYQSLFH